MTRGRKAAVITVVVVVALAAAVAVYLGPIAPVATGYASKITCSAHFVSGRSFESASADLPGNPLLPFLRWSLDEDAQTVSASLLGLWDSTAWYTPGVGCTLADKDPVFAPLALGSTDPGVAWPEGGLVEPDANATRQGIDVAGLDAAVDTAFVEDRAAGDRNTRAVVVAHDGRIVAERYADGFSADTSLLGWSMGKSIANAIIGRLVHESQLSVADYGLRPEWEGDQRSGITIDHLLHMTSGLAFDEVYDPNTDATNMLFLPGSTAVAAASEELIADPGTRWSYSSGTTNILCDAAQQASGMGVEMARELVFEPVGMTSAVMEPDASGGLVCSSFPYMTARDWTRFGQWYLQDGVWAGQRLLPEGWVDASSTPVELPTDNPYGAHWWLDADAQGNLRMPAVPADAYWASGNEGQQVVVIPSRGLVVVRLGFTSDFSGIAWG